MCRMFTSSSCSYDLRSTPYKADHGDTCVCAQLTGVSELARTSTSPQRDSNETDVTLTGSSLGSAAMEKLRFRLKGIVHLQIKILSSFTHSRVAPNPCDVRSSVECLRNVFSMHWQLMVTWYRDIKRAFGYFYVFWSRIIALCEEQTLLREDILTMKLLRFIDCLFYGDFDFSVPIHWHYTWKRVTGTFFKISPFAQSRKSHWLGTTGGEIMTEMLYFGWTNYWLCAILTNQNVFVVIEYSVINKNNNV